jgi:hypothetical protein
MRYALVAIVSLFLSCQEVSMTDSGRIPLKDLKLRPAPRTVVWGAKVSDEFRAELYRGCNVLCIEPDPIMACMAFETDRTFSPKKTNYAGSGAIGLIQFMPDTARYLGTSTADLAKMTAVAQLEFVFKHFEPYANRLVTLEDYYMTILMPTKIGLPLTEVLFRQDYLNRRNLLAYVQNKGLDKNFDGKITKEEAARPIREIYEEGKKYIK